LIYWKPVYGIHIACICSRIGMDVRKVQEAGLQLPLYMTIVQMFSKQSKENIILSVQYVNICTKVFTFHRNECIAG
jgi:hypothetical protein